MAHVHVDHSVACIAPHYGKVASRDGVFESYRIVLGIEREQYFYLLIQARAGLPDVPLVCRRGERPRKVTCHGMGAVVDDESRWKCGPIVAVEDAPAKKINKPRPARALIIVSSHMKAKPCAAVLHVVLERRALLCFGRKIIDPQDQLEAL